MNRRQQRKLARKRIARRDEVMQLGRQWSSEEPTPTAPAAPRKSAVAGAPPTVKKPTKHL